jgi:hypothetical protein
MSKVKKAIKSKFGKIARVSVISGIPYGTIIEADRHNRKYRLDEIMEKVKTLDDRPVGNEVTPEFQAEIIEKWNDCDQDKISKEFGQDWIEGLLYGTRRRFRTQKISRLIKRMEETK